MSKSPKKAAKPSKKTTATKPKKAAPKLKLKATAKPKVEAKGSRRGFMWKVLEEKQQKLKDSAHSPMSSANPEERAHAHANLQGHGRFHGPRRRVG